MNNSGFGLARIKQEGTPAHPEDIYIHCGCKKCEARWQKQLKAYNKFHEKSGSLPAHKPSINKE